MRCKAKVAEGMVVGDRARSWPDANDRVRGLWGSPIDPPFRSAAT